LLYTCNICKYISICKYSCKFVFFCVYSFRSPQSGSTNIVFPPSIDPILVNQIMTTGTNENQVVHVFVWIDDTFAKVFQKPRFLPPLWKTLSPMLLVLAIHRYFAAFLFYLSCLYVLLYFFFKLPWLSDSRIFVTLFDLIYLCVIKDRRNPDIRLVGPASTYCYTDS
jgi:hypothetical protein